MPSTRPTKTSSSPENSIFAEKPLYESVLFFIFNPCFVDKATYLFDLVFHRFFSRVRAVEKDLPAFDLERYPGSPSFNDFAPQRNDKLFDLCELNIRSGRDLKYLSERVRVSTSQFHMIAFSASN